MIVHLFPKEKFTIPFIKFINKNFNINEHLFIIYGSNIAYNEDEVKKYTNIIYVNKKNKRNFKYLIKYIYRADKIIIHGLLSNKLSLILFFQPWIFRRSYWVIWGGDLYEYKLKVKYSKFNINEKIRSIIIKNVNGLITQVEGDYKLAKKWYGAKGKYYYSFVYPSNLYKNIDLSKNKKEDNYIYIQVGNSASYTNNHIEIFNKLIKYKSSNIKIICPLSYGENEYRESIIKYGEDIFGDKFIPIIDFLPLDKYLNILSKIDIAIFNHKRQQAIGNITTLIGLGKKVYVRSDISTWEFCKSHNLKVFDSSSNLNNLLEKLSELDTENNKLNIKKYFSEVKLKKDLEKIFK